MSATTIVILGLLAIVIAMAIVIFMPKNCNVMSIERFATLQRGLIEYQSQ